MREFERTKKQECTDCWNCGDDLAQLQLVQNCRLTGGVEADHENAHLLLAEQAFEKTREHVTHGGGFFFFCRATYVNEVLQAVSLRAHTVQG